MRDFDEVPVSSRHAGEDIETSLSPEAYLISMIEPIIDHPEAATVEKTVDEMGVLLSLSVAQPDMGKIIGKEGGTARAIRHLLRNFGVIHSMRISLRINEPEGKVREA